jgi:hypothetical protein
MALFLSFKDYTLQEFNDLLPSCPICEGRFIYVKDNYISKNFYRECSKCDIDFLYEQEYIEILIGSSAYINNNCCEIRIIIEKNPTILSGQIFFGEEKHTDLNIDFSKPLNINDIYNKYLKLQVLA